MSAGAGRVVRFPDVVEPRFLGSLVAAGPCVGCQGVLAPLRAAYAEACHRAQLLPSGSPFLLYPLEGGDVLMGPLSPDGLEGGLPVCPLGGM